LPQNRKKFPLCICDPVVRNNVIDAGIGYETIGIKNICASPRILNNTFFTGSGSKKIHGETSSATGITNDVRSDYPTWDSNPVVINNIFLAIGENKSNHNLELNVNDGSGATEMTHNTYEIFENGLPSDTVTNVSDTELYNSLHRDSLSLFDSASADLRTGGKDLSSEYQTDINGITRPAGAWSRGAWQWIN